jgi:hypothetical protein
MVFRRALAGVVGPSPWLIALGVTGLRQRHERAAAEVSGELLLAECRIRGESFVD